MGNLKVKPVEITIAKRNYKVLFTVSAIYEVQEVFKKPFFEAIKCLNHANKDICKNVLEIIIILIRESANQEVTMNALIENLTAQDILKLILVINNILKVSCSLENDVDDDIDYIEDKTENVETPDLCERMFTIGHEFGYRDNEIWNMTPRQMFCMLKDYNKSKTGDKPKKTIEDIL